MKALLNFLENSYTAYQATENSAVFLEKQGFCRLLEEDSWALERGGKYFVIRNGSSLIAFTIGEQKVFRIVASHTDSPCLKLKELPALSDGIFTRINVEPYGGGLYYSFFDRPLKLAGRIVSEQKDGSLCAENYVSPFEVVIPSLAIHMNREANEKFSPNPQTDLLPLFATGKADLDIFFRSSLSYDLYAVCAQPPFLCGAEQEFVCAPRIDNLTSVFSSLRTLASARGTGVCIAACLDSEEIGSRTRQGAGGDFLKSVLARVSDFLGLSREERYRAFSSSFLISLDNAHSVHPNHPEKCDPTNRAVLGGGIVIKGHAGGAYTTDALSSAVIKHIFKENGVKYQTFYNRSDQRSGSTLGAISLGQVSIPSADLGLAQLAMHSAVETFSSRDYQELEKGLAAFYASEMDIGTDCVRFRT